MHAGYHNSLKNKRLAKINYFRYQCKLHDSLDVSQTRRVSAFMHTAFRPVHGVCSKFVYRNQDIIGANVLR